MKMSAEIMIVDDEAAIADLVDVYLKNEGYTVHKFYTATQALECVEQKRLDLAILDVMLPDMDGFTLCQKIRERHLFPILMLTAKVEDMDKITGLTLGADDYITKPFDPLELVARVKTQAAAVERRSPRSTTFGDYRFPKPIISAFFLRKSFPLHLWNFLSFGTCAAGRARWCQARSFLRQLGAKSLWTATILL